MKGRAASQVDVSSNETMFRFELTIHLDALSNSVSMSTGVLTRIPLESRRAPQTGI